MSIEGQFFNSLMIIHAMKSISFKILRGISDKCQIKTEQNLSLSTLYVSMIPLSTDRSDHYHFELNCMSTVSYTHLTLPTTERV